MLKISLNMILDSLERLRVEPLFSPKDDLFFSGLRLYERDRKSVV